MKLYNPPTVQQQANWGLVGQSVWVWTVVCLYSSALWWTGDLSRVTQPSPEDAEIGSKRLFVLWVVIWQKKIHQYIQTWKSLSCRVSTDPCPPESLTIMESSEGNCSLAWDTVPHAESYVAIIKRNDGSEEKCNTSGNKCTYHCKCGYTFLMSVFPLNQAGSSPEGQVLNYTTCK